MGRSLPLAMPITVMMRSEMGCSVEIVKIVDVGCWLFSRRLGLYIPFTVAANIPRTISWAVTVAVALLER
jgi:hypothetical protein